MSVVLIIGGVLIILYKKKIIFKNLFKNTDLDNATVEANTYIKIIENLASLKKLYESNAIDGIEFIKKKDLLLKELNKTDEQNTEINEQ